MVIDFLQQPRHCFATFCRTQQSSIIPSFMFLLWSWASEQYQVIIPNTPRSYCYMMYPKLSGKRRPGLKAHGCRLRGTSHPDIILLWTLDCWVGRGLGCKAPGSWSVSSDGRMLWSLQPGCSGLTPLPWAPGSLTPRNRIKGTASI